MNPHIETMLLLQRRLQAGNTTDIDKLRAQLPAVVLAHFDRLIAQGRKGVAEVRHGVCGACHLRMPAAMVVPNTGHADLELCENCGAYLIFPAPDAASEKPAVRSRRRQAVAVV